MAVITSNAGFDSASFDFSALQRAFIGGGAGFQPGVGDFYGYFLRIDTKLILIAGSGRDLGFEFEGDFFNLHDNGITYGNLSLLREVSWEIPHHLRAASDFDVISAFTNSDRREWQTTDITDFSFSGKAITDAAKTPSTADEKAILRTILSGNDSFDLSPFADRAEGFGGNDTMKGNAGNDRLSGGSGNDRLEGGGGADRLSGGTGADILIGGGGNDRLTGGTGRDTLAGNGGADRFVFASAADAGKGSNRDVITDFSRSQGDRIDLKAIDARTGTRADDAFKFIGGKGFSKKAGELRYSSTLDRVQGDTNGDGKADFELRIDNGASLGAGDFIL